ncbi:MAG: hypothetical protein IJZ37_06290 [Clostridia bacterium]|nr:hypothetical protein [Clostridia bacterium]MBQ8400091.1 hypothetical protein [Clostridia bacterium]
MQFFSRFKKKKAQEQALKQSPPVISRSGKIGRVDPGVRSISEERKEEQQAQSPYVQPEVAEQGVSISDHAFLIKSGERAAKKAKKRLFYTVKNKERAPFPVMTVIFCIICTVLFMSMMVNFVQINEYTKEVSALQTKVNNLSKQKNELSAELDQKDSVEELREYLESKDGNLGMVEESNMNPPVAISPDKEDRVEDYEVPEESEGMITVVLNALAENLSNAWNIFTGNE